MRRSAIFASACLAGLVSAGCKSGGSESPAGSAGGAGSDGGVASSEASVDRPGNDDMAGVGGGGGSQGGQAGSDADGGADRTSGDDAGDTSDADAGDDSVAPDCVTPATPGACVPTATPICKLSLTGCMSATDVTSFAAAAIPYQVNSPLWSDGANKTRAFVLPQGGKIHIKDCTTPGNPDLASCKAGSADTGRWVFPVGTVMIKNFLFDGKLVETRLFMHADAATATAIGNGSEWVGYSYAWNEAQTEATLNPNERTEVMFDTGQHIVDWHFPHRADCMTCHNTAVNTLGPETPQMNRVVNGTNQIDAFIKMNLFDLPLTKPYQTAFVEPYANASLGLTGPPAGQTTAAARSYLHANCGYCHRPDWNDLGFDLRYALSLKDTGICNLAAQKPATGVDPGTTKILAPGSHASSALWIRLEEQVVAGEDPQASYRMPQIATYAVDEDAGKLLAQWIDGTASCPQ